MSRQNRLLIVDDESEMRSFFRDIAEEMGFVVEECGDHETFDATYGLFEPTVILLDLSVPGRDGIEFLRELDKRGCRAPSSSPAARTSACSPPRSAWARCLRWR